MKTTETKPKTPKLLAYQVTSNEYTGMCRQFTTKKEAVSHARWQRKAGWDATVVDMRTDKEILALRAGERKS